MTEHTDSELMREAVRGAVQDSLTSAVPMAIRAAARDPETWAAMQSGWADHLSNRAGNWMMKMVWHAVGRLMMFVVLGSLVYAMGGWTAVAALFGSTQK